MSVRFVLAATLLPVAVGSLALLGAGSAAAATPAQLLPPGAWTVSIGVQGSPVTTQEFGDLRGVELLATRSMTGGIELEDVRTGDPMHLRIGDRTGQALSVTITELQPHGVHTVVDRSNLTPDSTLVFAPDGL
ncbi:hypothetical protein FDO65_15280 [Nakamurella flava]|uniref:Uncharacterized protein n=1 Tax=Nakamurella flava TaxID=2576308 RepID=A0A4U6QFU2_9ACTN|nr:hypothetical protein [Nakamurella flava]TKV58859.1 hypothetical protein FDO65_15280 [Nakamurella flava]